MRTSSTAKPAPAIEGWIVPRSLRLAWLGIALMLQWGAACGAAGQMVSSSARYHEASGELKFLVGAPIDRVWKAALDMVNEMEYGTSRRRKGADRAEIGALTARQTPIEVQMKAVPRGRTRIIIRVGDTGSERLSRVLLENITNRL